MVSTPIAPRLPKRHVKQGKSRARQSKRFVKRYLALFGALLFLGHPAAVPAAPASAQALLALHRQYVGRQFNDGSLHGLRMREVATRGTRVLARGSVERVGLIYRVDLHNVASDTSISRGFTGRNVLIGLDFLRGFKRIDFDYP